MKEWVWVEERETLALHGRMLSLHGGAAGVRDDGLLKSALARPQQYFAHRSPDVYELAALYTSGIVRNHSFIDGNKRTGFVDGILFLELNGIRFSASEENATCAVLALATGEANEADYLEFLRQNSGKA